MYRKVLSMALLCIATAMLVLPQLGNTEEALNKTTDNKKFQIEITPPQDGFKVGTNDLGLKVFDAKGKVVKGAVISIRPWMPSMGHGVMLKPEVKETGKGIYAAKNVGFSMPGKWQLVVTVSKKDVGDRVTFEFASIDGGAVAKTIVACNCGTGGNCPPSCLCGCQAGVTTPKCNMKGGKCLGNCTCGCKEGKPCQMKDGKCIGGCGCGCQSAGVAAKCNMAGGKCQGNCTCGCKEGKPCNMVDGKCVGGCGCGCQAGPAVTKCNMKGGKCLGNCSCGCKEGKPCQMKDGRCIGGCGCGCQAGATAFNCPCGTGGNCPSSCRCGCQSTNVPNCKCGPGCTTLINCSCGNNCACAMDGKDGCGCIAGCRSGCPNGVCPLPKKTGTS